MACSKISENLDIQRAGRVWAGVAVVSAAVLVSGCGFVPRAKLGECHRLTQTLRADNTRLKNVALELRTQNQDLAQRAVDDARKIAAQDEAVERLEKSVQAYQTERDSLATAFESMKRQIRLSATTQPSAAVPPKLESFAAQRPGWSYEAARGELTVSADRLFESGSSRLRAAARDDLAALSKALDASVAESDDLEIASQGRAGADEVRRAGFDGDGAAADAARTSSPSPSSPPSGRFLLVARAAAVRETLIGSNERWSGRVRLAGPKPVATAPPKEADPGESRLVLRVVPRAGGLDAGESTDK